LIFTSVSDEPVAFIFMVEEYVIREKWLVIKGMQDMDWDKEQANGSSCYRTSNLAFFKLFRQVL
jgi:hypothetical protein